MNGEEINRNDLEECINHFDDRLAKFDTVQSEFELSFDTEEEINSEIEDASKFRRELIKDRCAAMGALNTINTVNQERTEATLGNSALSTGYSSKHDPKLPKLVIPKFDGNVLQWESFWDQFNVSIHESNQSDVNKFSYLKGLVEGEARQVIEGLSLTAANYKEARDLLVNRFGRKEPIILSHVQELLSMVSNKNESKSVANLRKLQDKILI